MASRPKSADSESIAFRYRYGRYRRLVRRMAEKTGEVVCLLTEIA